MRPSLRLAASRRMDPISPPRPHGLDGRDSESWRWEYPTSSRRSFPKKPVAKWTEVTPRQSEQIYRKRNYAAYLAPRSRISDFFAPPRSSREREEPVLKRVRAAYVREEQDAPLERDAVFEPSLNVGQKERKREIGNVCPKFNIQIRRRRAAERDKRLQEEKEIKRRFTSREVDPYSRLGKRLETEGGRYAQEQSSRMNVFTRFLALKHERLDIMSRSGKSQSSIKNYVEPPMETKSKLPMPKSRPRKIAKRLPNGMACNSCRIRKVRCNGSRPCLQCCWRDEPCDNYQKAKLGNKNSKSHSFDFQYPIQKKSRSNISREGSDLLPRRTNSNGTSRRLLL